MSEWAPLPEKFWAHIDRGQQFDYNVTQAARSSLQRYVHDQDHKSIFEDENPSVVNHKLRTVLKPYLHDPSTLQPLARWIVSDWGGIRRGLDAIPLWLKDLDNFSAAATLAFASRYGTERVSSWSKILAFALPDDYAVYDARVAAALNCGLASINDDRWFKVPPSQSTVINEWASSRNDLNVKRKRGYLDYMEIVRGRAESDKSKSILGLEMMLFSNAPILVR
jgi:hypothetical protein